MGKNICNLTLRRGELRGTENMERRDHRQHVRNEPQLDVGRETGERA
jgi:hypothetical protein